MKNDFTIVESSIIFLKRIYQNINGTWTFKMDLTQNQEQQTLEDYEIMAKYLKEKKYISSVEWVDGKLSCQITALGIEYVGNLPKNPLGDTPNPETIRKLIEALPQIEDD